MEFINFSVKKIAFVMKNILVLAPLVDIKAPKRQRMMFMEIRHFVGVQGYDFMIRCVFQSILAWL